MKRLSCILAWLFLCLPCAATAGDAARNVHLLRLSADLFDTARIARDPLMALTAAKIRKSVAVDAVALAPEGGAASVDVSWTGWADMLDTAVDLAAGDEILLSIAEDIRLEKPRGKADNIPARTGGEVRPGEKNVYRNVAFSGGAYAEVYVEGSGTADIDLFVHTSDGRLVCSDSDASNRSYCGWLPKETSDFSITIQNKGTAANRYWLITN